MNPKRRPKTCLSADQKAVIEKVWEETRLGARLLFYELRRRGQHIPHNKIWLEYDRHRWRFDSPEAFLTWYNNRIHGALDYPEGETPG